MDTSYKPPLPRLLRFFQLSRDQWKQRTATKQKLIRQLRVQVRDLSRSRGSWKQQALQLRQELQRLQVVAEEHPAKG